MNPESSSRINLFYRVSDQSLNGTSAQSGYIVPFTSVHAGKYVTEEKSKTDTTKTKHNPEKANNAKYSRTKLPWLVASYDSRPGNEVGLFYKAPEPTRGTIILEQGHCSDMSEHRSQCITHCYSIASEKPDNDTAAEYLQ